MIMFGVAGFYLEHFVFFFGGGGGGDLSTLCMDHVALQGENVPLPRGARRLVYKHL